MSESNEPKNDSTNEAKRFIQPYNSSHAPLPGASREFYATLSYTIH